MSNYLAKLAHPNTFVFRFHLLHPNFNSPTVPFTSPHPTIGTAYLPTFAPISDETIIYILQISPIRQFHLPSNLYTILKLFSFTPKNLPLLPFLPFIIPFSDMFFSHFDRNILMSQTKISTQLSTWEYTITLGCGFAGL